MRATVNDVGEVVSYDDYDPWGLILNGRSMTAQANLANKFTGKEWDDDFGLNWNYFGARYYDPAVARWMVIDPRAGDYPSLSPYNYVANNPLNATDPDGEFINFLIGAAVGAATDIALQVAVNYVQGNDLLDIKVGSVLVSAATGAVGLGFANKLNKISKLGTLGKAVSQGAKVGTDAAGSVANQLLKTGDVSLTTTFIDVAVGQAVGKAAGKIAGNTVGNATKSTEKILTRQANRAQRVANNASKSRQSARQATANTAQKKVDNLARRGVSASASASQVGSTVFKEAIKDEEK